MAFKDKIIRLVLSNYDIGAGKKGAAEGPSALLSELKLLNIHFKDTVILNEAGISYGETHFAHSKCIDSISKAAEQLNAEVISIIEKNEFPLIFSGDHSNAIGGISGLKNANPDKRIGVIWIDAHADLHSPYTTPSGNMHGMPLAALIGQDNIKHLKNKISEPEVLAWNQLKYLGKAGISPKINPSDLVFIDIRDAEPEEWGLIDDFKIKTFEPEDIRKHGIYHALNNAISYLNNCDLIYASFDADSLDPSISIGTGTTSPNGLKLSEAEAVFQTLMNLPNLAALEITEINPRLDGNGRKMANVIAALFKKGFNQN